MNNKGWEYDVERAFDRESDHDDGGASDAETKAYRRELELLRQGARTVARHERITDAQFPAFMAGINERIAEQPVRSHRGLWAFLSLASASLIVAVSTFVIIRGATPDATATVVEDVKTEIEGATVHWETSDDGGATVWVEIAEGDLW